ncbi:MAG: UDP-2,3-diacylglucosamine diphosphatase, partial [Burkholderiaceae bacterium]|nr:UDP-2,3-diacylglucosamine diphosphatase [Burkholderiaceae bacterium]
MPEHASALLISDLHLTPSMPLTAQRFFDFVEKETNDVESVFILGDLFEYWVGDDAGARSPFQQEVLRALFALSSKTKTYYIHGNRDFLIGQDFLKRSGMQLLPDPSKVMIAGDEWVISHGDALCIADTAYQAFRQQVRTSQWQSDFLSKPLVQRLQIARELRAQSEALKQTQKAWFDVDNAAALASLQEHGASVLIHGHTHQPALHTLSADHRRYV